MKRLIIFICFTLCVPTPAIAGVSNIKHMSRNANGSFDVICLNRTLETVNSKAILDDSVCSKTVTDKPPLARQLLICTGSRWSSHITRIPDGTTIGDSVQLEECQQSLKTSSSGFICTGSRWSSYITRISDGKTIGDSVQFEECQQSLKTSSSGFICTGSRWSSYLTRISDGKTIGDSVQFEECQQSVKALIDGQKS
jgi:hypothetical protein